ncbi:MAG: tripartite tricarboxylate transporter substrate binding protein [Methylobacteriaceae bacterium]|jgi:tripartite-type tricarboxylate transporter receptor subunit TctC|nr:tripartite tricarboxylate transporter substrate binding protein [Methylobacteriaceae bacterium]
MQFKYLVAAAIGLTLSAGTACAQFPEKEINLVIPWGVGGPTDIAARAFVPLFEKYLGKPVVIVNKPGAGGAIGTDFAYARPADGYTVVLSAETPAVFRVLGTSKLSFHDFDALNMLVYSEKLIVVSADSKYQTMKDLVDDMKARPGKVRFSYTGPGSSGHIQGLLLKDKSGLDISMTPFTSGNESLLAAVGGQVDFTAANLGTVKDFLASGKMRALAMYSSKRSDFTPDIPPITDTLPELAPYLPLEFPTALLVKKGTPEDAQKVLLEAAQKAAADPAWADFKKNTYYVGLEDLTGQKVIDYWDNWASIVAWLLYDAKSTKFSPAEFNIPKK